MRLKAGTLVQQHCANDDGVGTHGLLVVVGVGGAVRACISSGTCQSLFHPFCLLLLAAVMFLVLGMRRAVEPEAECRGRMNDMNLTVVAVDALSRVTGVGVSLEVALGELEVLARNNGVQGEGGAGEDFAGVAVAEDGVLAVRCMLVFCILRKWKRCVLMWYWRVSNGWTYLGSSTTHSASIC